MVAHHVWPKFINANTLEQSGVRHAPVSVYIVVERKFLELLDVTVGKDAHADMFANGPFRDVAVWTAAVIRKAANSASLRGIDELEYTVATLAT